MSLKSEGSPHPFPFYMYLFYRLMFLDWLKLVSQKDRCHSVLAARDASVNSLFHIWVFSFSCRGWRNLMSFGYFFPCQGQIQPGLLCASALAQPHPVLPPSQHPSAAVGPFVCLRLASTHHLKPGPKSPSRRSWEVFFQDSRDCESLMKRKNFVPKERSANTLCFPPLKLGQWFPLLCFLNVIWLTLSLQAQANVGSADRASKDPLRVTVIQYFAVCSMATDCLFQRIYKTFLSDAHSPLAHIYLVLWSAF